MQVKAFDEKRSRNAWVYDQIIDTVIIHPEMNSLPEKSNWAGIEYAGRTM